jgi:hypothetical protein
MAACPVNTFAKRNQHRADADQLGRSRSVNGAGSDQFACCVHLSLHPAAFANFSVI